MFNNFMYPFINRVFPKKIKRLNCENVFLRAVFVSKIELHSSDFLQS